MKRFLAALMLGVFLTVSGGCATTGTTTTGTTTSSIMSEDVVISAQKTLLASGALLQSTPVVMDSLYAAGTMTKEEYNSVAALYNKFLAGWNLAVSYLKVGASSETYLTALTGMLSTQKELETLLLQFEGGSK
jgi:hypothetical protein